MRLVSGRSLLRGSFGLVAAGTLTRPHFANAAATTAWAHPAASPPAIHGPAGAAYVQHGPMSPAVPYYQLNDRAYAQLLSEHDRNVAWSDIVTGGMTQQGAEGMEAA